MANTNRIYMVRVSREIQKLQTDLPPEITCWPDDENIYDKFSAVMKGPPDSPYFGGKFSLAINLPSRYPYEAPKVNFVTRIYHPNIDENGRICLEILKPQPKGSWKPGFNMITVLLSIYLLLSNPNPDDPLVIDVATQFKNDRILFNQTAEAMTKKHATGNDSLVKSEGLETTSIEETNGLPSKDIGTRIENTISKGQNINVSGRPHSKIKSLSLKKLKSKDNIPLSSLNGAATTPVKKSIDQSPPVKKTALSNIISPKKSSRNSSLNTDASISIVLEESGTPIKPVTTVEDASKSISPILEAEEGAKVIFTPLKKKLGGNCSTPRKKKNPKRGINKEEDALLRRSLKTTSIKKRTIEQERLPPVGRKLKKLESFTEKPKKLELAHSAALDDGKVAKVKKLNDGDVEPDLSIEGINTKAKLTLTQSEDTQLLLVELKAKSNVPKKKLTSKRVFPDEPDQPIIEASKPTSDKSISRFNTNSIDENHKPIRSSYFSSGVTDAAADIDTRVAPKALLPTFDAPEIGFLPNGFSLQSEKKLIQPQLNILPVERKRGWRPPPLVESASILTPEASATPQRRPTFSLKKLKGGSA